MFRKRRSPWVLFLLLVSLFLLYAAVNTHLVRVKTLSYPIEGLDPGLNGTRVLFLSDLKIKTERDARHAARLLKRLCADKPDLLIIGGDLTEADGDLARSERALNAFLDRTKELSCPGGMYIVYGDTDLLIGEDAVRRTHFTLLNNQQIKINLRGGSLVLAGYSYSENAQVSRGFQFTDEGTGALIVVSHTPENGRLVPYRTGADKRPYADLILCGHTLGGQIRLFGKSLLYTALNEAYPSEEADALGVPMLISRGIGTEKAPFRLFTQPSAYYITLKTGGI